MYRIKGYIGYLKTFIIYLFAGFLSIFKSQRRNDLWLISERGTDARDNGYFFFKYLCENHPEINCAYVISSDSADFKKVAALGKTIKYRSLSHYLAFVNAKVLISTHICGYTPHMYFFSQLDKRFKIIKQPKIFLQHGITKDNVSELHCPNVRLDLFICGAKREFEEISATFGHPSGVVRCTGFCRYDNLPRDGKAKKQILLMPTWRKSLISCASEDEFKGTEYYRRFNDFINDKRVTDCLAEHGCTMLFYPHYELQRFAGAFSPESELVKIAEFDRYDVQRLLIDSAMLITDYSSVFFDVAYMKKPIIHYLFDDAEYRRTHYSQGYFDFEKSFGKAVKSHEELVEEFLRIMNNGIKADDIYLERASGFFGEISDCCRKNFDAINEIANR